MGWALTRATREERRRVLPGDTEIPDALGTLTHCITIAAPREEVWPWLVQMGSTRAGWYSYDRVDNAGVPSQAEVLRELQEVKPGDLLPSLPGATDSFFVLRSEPPVELVLYVPGPGRRPRMTWDFWLEELDRGRTRLFARARISPAFLAPMDGAEHEARAPVEYLYRVLPKLPFPVLKPFIRFGHGIMQRKQLRGIRERAEGRWVAATSGQRTNSISP